MSTVVQVSRTARQPFGGYLKPREMNQLEYDDGKQLFNIRDFKVKARLISLVVRKLTRINLGAEKRETFIISLLGAKAVSEREKAAELLDNIHQLENETIINACKLVGYDSAFRSGTRAYRSVEHIHPAEKTIEDIRVMVERNLEFLEENGPILKRDLSFEGAYTMQIQTGEADFLTEDTLWNLKALKGSLRTSDTLELLMYYILGLDSVHKEQFEKLTKIGIFDARSNTAYVKNTEEIPKKLITQVRENVIGY